MVVHNEDSRFDENDLEDVDDIMDYYRLDSHDLIQLDDTVDDVSDDDIDDTYYLDN